MKLSAYLKAERGRTSQLARKLGVSVSLVSMWANRIRPVPPVYAFKIERMTRVVSVESLCPGMNFRRGKR